MNPDLKILLTSTFSYLSDFIVIFVYYWHWQQHDHHEDHDSETASNATNQDKNHQNTTKHETKHTLTHHHGHLEHHKIQNLHISELLENENNTGSFSMISLNGQHFKSDILAYYSLSVLFLYYLIQILAVCKAFKKFKILSKILLFLPILFPAVPLLSCVCYIRRRSFYSRSLRYRPEQSDSDFDFYCQANLKEINLISAIFTVPISLAFIISAWRIFLEDSGLDPGNNLLLISFITLLSILASLSHLIFGLIEFISFKKYYENNRDSFNGIAPMRKRYDRKKLDNVLYKSNLDNTAVKLAWTEKFITIPNLIIGFFGDKVTDIISLIVYVQVLLHLGDSDDEHDKGFNINHKSDYLVLIWTILSVFIYILPDLIVSLESNERIKAFLDINECYEKNATKKSQNKSTNFLKNSKTAKYFKKFGLGSILLFLDVYHTIPDEALIAYKLSLIFGLSLQTTYFEGCPQMMLQSYIYTVVASNKYEEISKSFDQTFSLFGQELFSNKQMILFSILLYMTDNITKIVFYKLRIIQITVDTRAIAVTVNYSLLAYYSVMIVDILAQLLYSILRVVWLMYLTTVLIESYFCFVSVVLVAIIRTMVLYMLSDEIMNTPKIRFHSHYRRTVRTLSWTRTREKSKTTTGTKTPDRRSEGSLSTFTAQVRKMSTISYQISYPKKYKTSWINENKNTRINKAKVPLFSFFVHNLGFNIYFGLINYSLLFIELLVVKFIIIYDGDNFTGVSFAEFYGFDVVATFVCSCLFSYLSSFMYNCMVVYKRASLWKMVRAQGNAMGLRNILNKKISEV